MTGPPVERGLMETGTGGPRKIKRREPHLEMGGLPDDLTWFMVLITAAVGGVVGFMLGLGCALSGICR